MLERKHFTKISLIAFGLCFVWCLGVIPAALHKMPRYIRSIPFWPKRLPNKWSSQQFVDIYVSKDDHIWAINRYWMPVQMS